MSLASFSSYGDLFCCTKCKHVDSAALANIESVGPTMLCTMCKTGKWHDVFEYKVYDRDTVFVMNDIFDENQVSLD